MPTQSELERLVKDAPMPTLVDTGDGERCTQCPHGWHGLVCIKFIYDYNVVGASQKSICGCPPQWVEPVVDSDDTQRED